MSPPNTQAILALATYLLPRSTSSTLTQPTDLVALVIHAVQVSLGFRSDPAAAVDDQEVSNDQDDGEEDDDAATAVGDDVVPDSEHRGFTSLGVTSENAQQSRLPQGWNARGEDSYTFQYRHEQSQMGFTIKVGRMGGRVCVSGMAEDGEPHQFSILLSDYVQPSTLPWPRQDEPSSRQRPLSEGFTSSERLQELVTRFTREIVAVLVPGIPLPGVSTAEDTRGHPQPRPPRGGILPQPFPSTTEDRPPNAPRYNPSIGHRDLDPTAAFQPPGMRPPGTWDPTHDGGGMLVDFNHPLFAGRGRSEWEGPGGMMAPPGARWDPVGPGFPTGGGGGSGNGRGNIGDGSAGRGLGDPDFDELLPPGEYGPDLRMPGQRGGRTGRGGMGGGMGMDPFGGMGGGFGRGPGGGGGGGGFGGFGGGGGFM